MKILPNRGATSLDRDFAIRQITEGRSNCNGTVTLAANLASTTVSKSTFHTDAAPLLVPMTANAAAELANGTLYISAVTGSSFTITHANNAQTDRTFRYALIGG